MAGVAVVAFDRISVFELSVACEVFGTDRSDMGLPNYRFWVCAAEPPPLHTNGGMTLRPGLTLSSLTEAGTIVVPAWRDIGESPPARLLAALRRAHQRGARIASFCNGAFVLAAAGLLDGRRATTHWMYAAELARRFPSVRVDPSVLYVDEGNVLTSAGTAAAIDLCLHMVRRDHGVRVANAFARRMVVAPHRSGGQSQYVEAPVVATAGTDGLGQAMEWARRHLDRSLTVECLAERAHMSARTFARRFRAVTGTTPLQWLLHQRILTAQQLLEETELSCEQVAERCGFGRQQCCGCTSSASSESHRPSIGPISVPISGRRPGPSPAPDRHSESSLAGDRGSDEIVGRHAFAAAVVTAFRRCQGRRRIRHRDPRLRRYPQQLRGSPLPLDLRGQTQASTRDPHPGHDHDE